MKKKNLRWTIDHLIENRHSVEFPEYQREPTVWNLEKKRRLIDSILRGFDIASLYFYQREENVYDCIDGRQRINAILSYVGVNVTDTDDNKFQLSMTNEIYQDDDTYDAGVGKTFESGLPRSN